jgi:hypothetical protein
MSNDIHGQTHSMLVKTVEASFPVWKRLIEDGNSRAAKDDLLREIKRIMANYPRVND